MSTLHYSISLPRYWSFSFGKGLTQKLPYGMPSRLLRICDLGGVSVENGAVSVGSVPVMIEFD